MLDEKKIKGSKIKDKDKNDYDVKISDIKSNKVRCRKIRIVDIEREEKELDRKIENEDNLSIAVMVFILVLCFAVGIFLGYMLYNIAINGGM